MSGLLAGDVGGLAAGCLVAWVLGALVRLAACPPPRAVRAGSRLITPRRCRRGRTSPLHVARSAWLECLLPAGVLLALAVGVALDAAHVPAATIAGACCGVWLARRHGPFARPRLIAAVGCTLGAAVVAGGFALELLGRRDGMFDRGALYGTVLVGSWMFAASASAWFLDFAARDDTHARRRPARYAVTPSAFASAFDDRITYGLAMTLCVALAFGFVAADASAQFRFGALVAACGLASALGVRMMTGARFRTISSDRTPIIGSRAVVARADTISFGRAGLVGIPDELLVAACADGMFDVACLFPLGAGDTGRDALRYGDAVLPAVRRRQRGRYGSAGRQGGTGAH